MLKVDLDRLKVISSGSAFREVDAKVGFPT
jgi:hypothetical protein